MMCSDTAGTGNQVPRPKRGPCLTDAYVEVVRAEARLEAADGMADEWTLNGAESGLDGNG